MNSLLVSILAKTVLFALSAFIGMVSYVLVSGSLFSGEARKADASFPVSGVPKQTIEFNAEPVLLARTANPVDLSADSSGTYFILESDGDIVRISPDAEGINQSSNRYLSLKNNQSDPVIGFTAIALHPHFRIENQPGYGKFYVVAGEKSGSGTPDFAADFSGEIEHHQDVLYEFTASDPNAAMFAGNGRELMRFSQPGPEHNVSSLVFDEKGCLFISVGDGAKEKVARRSASKNASSLTNAYGKILRVDPLGTNSANGKYGIPTDNPFHLVSDALTEIWAFGIRAPHSLSYDPYQKRLYIGEIASDETERILVSSNGGEHFGWDLESGNKIVNLALRSELADMITSPIVTLDHTPGSNTSATGNFIYRGERFPALAGRVIIAGHSGMLLAASSESDSVDQVARLTGSGLADHRFSAVKTNARGELLILCEDGSIYEMRKGAALGDGMKKRRKLYCSVFQTETKITLL